MSTTVAIVLVVAVFLGFVLLLRDKAKARDAAMFAEMMLSAAQAAAHERRTEAATEPSRNAMIEEVVPLLLREFAFKCAEFAKTREDAYARAEPTLTQLDTFQFREVVHGMIAEFFEECGNEAPRVRHAVYMTARHEREQFQLANHLKLKALDGETPTTTGAQEMGLQRIAAGD